MSYELKELERWASTEEKLNCGCMRSEENLCLIQKKEGTRKELVEEKDQTPKLSRNVDLALFLDLTLVILKETNQLRVT